MSCPQVGVFLGDGFPLLSQTEIATNGTMRQGPEEAMCRPGTTTDGSPSAVEEAQRNPVGLTNLQQLLLGSEQALLARQNTPVLITVAIADHDLLGRSVPTSGLLLIAQAALG